MFFRGSRYETVGDAERTTSDGRVIRYKRVRFVPNVRGVFPYTVKQNDRPDLIAYQFYKDPEQFWRISDANTVMRPDELVAQPGARIVVPMPGAGEG